MLSSSLTAVRDDGRMSSPGPRSGGPTSRRSFTSTQKLDHLAAYEAAVASGQGGAYLRQHGLYSSLISEWRRLRDAGVLAGKQPGEKVGRLTAEQAERRLATTQVALDIMGKTAAGSPGVAHGSPAPAHASGRSRPRSPPGGVAVVDVGLTHPQPHRLGSVAQLGRDRLDRLVLGTQSRTPRPGHPHRRGLLLFGVPTRGGLPLRHLSWHDSVLVSKVRSLQPLQGDSKQRARRGD